MATGTELEHCLDGAEQALAYLGFSTVRGVISPTESSDTVAHSVTGPDGHLIWLRTSGGGIVGDGLLMVAGGSAICPTSSFPALEVMRRAGRATWGVGFATPDAAGEHIWCGLLWKVPVGALDASSPEALAQLLVGLMAVTANESGEIGRWLAATTGGAALGGSADEDLSILDAAIGTPPSPATAAPAVSPTTEKPAIEVPTVMAPTSGSRIRW